MSEIGQQLEQKSALEPRERVIYFRTHIQPLQANRIFSRDKQMQDDLKLLARDIEDSTLNENEIAQRMAQIGRDVLQRLQEASSTDPSDYSAAKRLLNLIFGMTIANKFGVFTEFKENFQRKSGVASVRGKDLRLAPAEGARIINLDALRAASQPRVVTMDGRSVVSTPTEPKITPVPTTSSGTPSQSTPPQTVPQQRPEGLSFRVNDDEPTDVADPRVTAGNRAGRMDRILRAALFAFGLSGLAGVAVAGAEIYRERDKTADVRPSNTQPVDSAQSTGPSVSFPKNTASSVSSVEAVPSVNPTTHPTSATNMEAVASASAAPTPNVALTTFAPFSPRPTANPSVAPSASPSANGLVQVPNPDQSSSDDASGAGSPNTSSPLTAEALAQITDADLQEIAAGLKKIKHGSFGKDVFAPFQRIINKIGDSTRSTNMENFIRDFNRGAYASHMKFTSLPNQKIQEILNDANHPDHHLLKYLMQDNEARIAQGFGPDILKWKSKVPSVDKNGSPIFSNGKPIYVNCEVRFATEKAMYERMVAEMMGSNGSGEGWDKNSPGNIHMGLVPGQISNQTARTKNADGTYLQIFQKLAEIAGVNLTAVASAMPAPAATGTPAVPAGSTQQPNGRTGLNTVPTNIFPQGSAVGQPNDLKYGFNETTPRVNVVTDAPKTSTRLAERMQRFHTQARADMEAQREKTQEKIVELDESDFLEVHENATEKIREHAVEEVVELDENDFEEVQEHAPGERVEPSVYTTTAKTSLGLAAKMKAALAKMKSQTATPFAQAEAARKAREIQKAA